MIGQSMINVKSGGRTRLSAFAAAMFLLAFILVASGLIEQIPLAALVGRNVYGGDRYICLAKPHHHDKSSAYGRTCHYSSDHRDRYDRP